MNSPYFPAVSSAEKVACPTCNKRVKAIGLAEHQRQAHGVGEVLSAPVQTAKGAMVQVKCGRCKAPFWARVADRNRGWGKFCSKSCKAIRQTQKTGWSGPGSGPRPGGSKKSPRHDGMSEMKHKKCDTCGAPAINGVYGVNGRIEWGCRLHHDTSHPFSSDALGQW